MLQKTDFFSHFWRLVGVLSTQNPVPQTGLSTGGSMYGAQCTLSPVHWLFFRPSSAIYMGLKPKGVLRTCHHVPPLTIAVAQNPSIKSPFSPRLNPPLFWPFFKCTGLSVH